MKRCSMCRTVKPLEDFSRRTRAADGRQARCRRCESNWRAEHRAPRVAAATEPRKTALANVRGLMEAYLLAHPCSVCGETDVRVLDFDHRPESGKSDNIGTMMRAGFAWSAILEEIAKCDVRCANCHRKLTCERASWAKHQFVEEQQRIASEAVVARIRGLVMSL